jgi:exodeoxyribonuclease VII small subunit
MNATASPLPTENIPVDQLTYEQAFAELEASVAALETGQHPLDETLRLFERGQELVRHCASLLDQAELKIQRLNGETLEDFTPLA